MLELYYEEVPSFLRNQAAKEASLGRTFRADEFLQKAEMVAKWLQNPVGSEFPIENPGYYGFKIINPPEVDVHLDSNDSSADFYIDLALEPEFDELFNADISEVKASALEETDQTGASDVAEGTEKSVPSGLSDETVDLIELDHSDATVVFDVREDLDGPEPSDEAVAAEPVDEPGTPDEMVETDLIDEVEEVIEIDREFLTFETDIQQVSDLLNAGDYLEAITAAELLLEGRERLSEEAITRLEDLRFAADEKQKSQIETLLINALNNYNANLFTEAEELCNQVLHLAKDDENATRLLGLIASKRADIKKDAINQDSLQKLISDLTIRNNLRELENAIRRAENITDKNDELEHAYTEARAYFDDTRRIQNELTTIMRLGQVEGCFNALQEIQKLKAEGQEVFADEGQIYRDINQVINEADDNWRKASKVTAQTGIQETDNFLHAHQYFVARDRLNQLLKLPLVDNDRVDIEAKYQEVESALSDIADIRIVREKADNANNPLEALKIVLTIDSEYKDLPEVISYREAYVESAAKWLMTQVNNELGEASRASKSYKFQAARDHIKDARDKILNLWPAVIERPDRLVELENEIRQSSSDVNEQALLYAEFIEKTNQIREMVSDPNQRKAGHKHLEQLKADQKYSKYPLTSDFLFEMVGYQEVSEQVSTVMDAHRNSRWQEAFDISQNLLKSGEVGEFVEQIKLINTEARNELEIIKLRSLINEQNLRSAHELMDRLITRDLKLKIRLAAEENILSRALTVSPQFTMLMEQAKQLESTDFPENLLHAVQIYRFAANMANTEPKPEWPQFELNFEIVDARNAFRSLKTKLQSTYLEDLVEAYRHKDSMTPDELSILAEKASVIRRGSLLETSEQRRAVSWIEIQHGLALGNALHQRNNLEQAIAQLKDLYKIYPNDHKVQSKLRELIKEKALSDVIQLMLVKKDPNSGLRLLEHVASEDFGLSNDWDFVLAYVEPYLLLNQYDDAKNQLIRAEKLGCPKALLASKRKQIELDRQTYQIVCEIEKHTEQKEYYEALVKIGQILDGDFENKKSIKKLQSKVFDQASIDIVDEIKALRGSDDEADQIKALLRALDLKTLEDLVGVDDDMRQSQKLIQPGLESKDQTIKYLMAEANRYAYSDYEINLAIEKARQIFERLTSFSKFLENMNESSEILERFDIASTRFQDQINDLTRINDILQQADEPDLWVDAIKYENFGKIELLTNQLEKTGYGLREMENLTIKKDEWQEDNRLIITRIATIKNLFDRGEFEETLSEIHNAEQRPLQRPSTGMGWRQLSEDDHRLILNLVNTRLTVVNIYSEDESNIDLIGWQAIKEASLASFREMDYWNETLEEIKTELHQVVANITKAESLDKGGNLEQRRQGWTVASDSSLALIELITQRTGHAAQSRAARDIKDSLLNTQNELQDQHEQANQKIKNLAGEIDQLWPSQDKIKLAMESKDLERLEFLIGNMETVGPKDTTQESILKTTKFTYDRLRQQIEKKKKIFGIF